MKEFLIVFKNDRAPVFRRVRAEDGAAAMMIDTEYNHLDIECVWELVWSAPGETWAKRE